jgi:hypothetical protein
VDVFLNGEEDVVSSGVVPVLRGRAHRPDPSGHEFVGLVGAGERCVVVGADEHNGGAATLGSVTGMRERPAAEERVVGEELVVVVRRPSGEVDLDEQVARELHLLDPELKR